jgi:hypothetical protein
MTRYQQQVEKVIAETEGGCAVAGGDPFLKLLRGAGIPSTGSLPRSRKARRSNQRSLTAQAMTNAGRKAIKQEAGARIRMAYAALSRPASRTRLSLKVVRLLLTPGTPQLREHVAGAADL